MRVVEKTQFPPLTANHRHFMVIGKEVEPSNFDCDFTAVFFDESIGGW